MPTLKQDECFEFLAWYETRTGKSRDLNNLTTENALLVLFMFELAQGMRLPEFARRFKRRLLRLNLFEVARTILAVNALYINAPLALIESDRDRDALARLCEEDQLHFRITSAEDGSAMEGVRLAHAHLAWLLFVEWVEPPTTLAKAWARELAKAMAVMESEPNSFAASNLLNGVLTTTRLSDTTKGDSLPPTASRSETIRELYRVHIQDQGRQPALATLPRWLDIAFKISGLNLNPDPVYYAIAGFSDDSRALLIHSSVAAWVWLISETRLGGEAERLREAAEEYLMRYQNNPGVGHSVARISALSQNKQAAKQFTIKWLNANPTHPQAYSLIAPLVAANPANAEMIKRAVDWLNANSTHPQAYWLIAPLVAANPGNAEMRERAVDWLNANSTHPQAYSLIAPLVAANAANAEMVKQAIDWLNANPSHPHAYQLIAPLVAANPANARVVQRAIDWLRVNSSHPQVNYVIDALVAANSRNSKVLRQALDWLLANRSHDNAHDVIAALISANPNDVEVTNLAIDWLDTDPTHPQAYYVIAALVAANPANEEAIRQATNWLAANPTYWQGYSLIVALVAANPANAEVMKQATNWLAANPTHLRAYHPIAALVAANPANAEIKTQATNWLAANPTHPQAYWLIAALVAANPANAEVTRQAIDWLDANPTHLQAYNLLPPLVKAGKATPTIIELVLSSIKQEHRDDVLPALARALADNLGNAVSYLNGNYAEERKRLVCGLIGKGMNPDVFAHFLYQGNRNIAPDHLRIILKSAVIEQAESDNLNAIIAQWLNENFREPVYWEMLDAFKPDYYRWVRIEGLGYLRSEIEQDFESLLRAP